MNCQYNFMLMTYSSRAKTVIKIISVWALFLPLVAIAVPIKISDPIGAGSPLEIYARIIKAFLGTVGIFALLNFVIAGVGLIASRGNQEAGKKNRDNMLWTIIGIALLFGAYAILAFVIDRLAGSLNIGTP